MLVQALRGRAAGLGLIALGLLVVVTGPVAFRWLGRYLLRRPVAAAPTGPQPVES